MFICVVYMYVCMKQLLLTFLELPFKQFELLKKQSIAIHNFRDTGRKCKKWELSTENPIRIIQKPLHLY